MPFINLIEEQRASARRKDAQARIGLYAFVGICAAVVLAYGAMLLAVASANRSQAELDARLLDLQQPLAEIDTNNKKMAEMQPKLDSLQQAQDMTDRWVRILDHLTTQMPDKTWLTALRSVGGDATKGININFIGLTDSQEPVANFILRAQNQPDLQNVSLKYTNDKSGPAGDQIEFEVSADVKGTAPVKPKEIRKD